MNETKQNQVVDAIDQQPTTKPHHVGQIPQWTVSLGILLTGVLYLFLPERLTIGPSWLLLALEACIITPLWIFHLSGRLLPYRLVRTLSLIVLGLVTLTLAGSVITLISELSKISAANSLLRTTALLWLSNITVFGLWYWDTDGGGPRKRHEAGHIASDFLFPQQASAGTPQQPNGEPWAPQFFDYFYLAFNTATAFSPTDTYPLTRSGKALMMVESMISLVIVGVLVSRVANIF